MRSSTASRCHGQRLNPQARAVTLTSRRPKFAERPERSLPEVCGLAVSEAEEFFGGLELDATGQTIAAEVLKEIRGRLQFLKNVGLEYLTLDRTAPTLSGGEMQRIRLAGQIGCGLVGVLYILDEPSIGLHPRDNDRLLETLARLRDQGNTVIVVEHDEDTMRAADHIVDFGPGPGVRGGHVVAAGPAAEMIAEPEKPHRAVSFRPAADRDSRRAPARSATPSSWSAARRTTISRTSTSRFRWACSSASPAFPARARARWSTTSWSRPCAAISTAASAIPALIDGIDGLEHLDKMIAIDQSPIGRTPRSNPATYIKVFDEIRQLYTQLPESKARGYKPGRFSFNVAGGRCEACEGNGSNRLEMDFLADVWVTCPVCEGPSLQPRDACRSATRASRSPQVLEMDIQEALTAFREHPRTSATSCKRCTTWGWTT